MKIYMKKYLYRLSKQGVLNFVGENPRLFTFLAGLGIAVVLSSIGRFFVHEVFAISSSSSSSLVPAVDYVDKTPVAGITQIKNEIICCTCSGCGASEFSPGHEAVSPGDAQNVAPGELAKSPGDASNLAPGQQLKK
jgi:hypothetical protein